MSGNYADLTVLIEHLRTAGNRVGPEVEQVLDQVANEVLTTQVATVPVRSGNLKSTLHIQSTRGKRVIGYDPALAPYGYYVEKGTRPHTIEAKPGKVLAFKVNGRTVYAKKVRHPGTRAQPFLAPSLDAWVRSLGSGAGLVGVKAVTGK